MKAKRFLAQILLVAGFVSLYFIYKYQSSIQDIWAYNRDKLKIYFDNFFFEAGAGMERRRPLTLAERETELKLYIGEPFRSFSRSEWGDFWNIVYGAFPKDRPEREGLPRKKRQLTQDEIAFELAADYPEPFSYFKEEHWKQFFGIIFRK